MSGVEGSEHAGTELVSSPESVPSPDDSGLADVADAVSPEASVVLEEDAAPPSPSAVVGPHAVAASAHAALVTIDHPRHFIAPA